MSPTAVVGVTYFATPTGWMAKGRETLPITADRSGLVSGTFIPNRLTSGLLPGYTPATLPNVVGTGSAINITTPGPYRDTLFWGTVNMKSPVMPEFYNCAFAGPNPLAGTGATGCIKADSTMFQWYAEDCLIDAGLWKDPTVVQPGLSGPMDFATWNRAVASHINGWHGGRGTLLRCEVKNVGDNVQSVQTMLSGSDTAFTLIRHSWLHGNAYYMAADWAAAGVQSDGNHADGFQFSTGQNFEIDGCLIGGVRDTTGYDIYNASTNPGGVSYNTGDDPFNAGIMVSQGGSTPPSSLQLLGNIEIHHSFFWGGKYGINHPQSDTRPNDFASFSCHDNLFVRRNDGTGNGALQIDGNYARYVNRDIEFVSLYANNRVADVNPDGTFDVGELIVYKNA